MTLKPTKRNLVVQFFQPHGNIIVSAAAETLSASFDDSQRTRVKIIALSKTLAEEGELQLGDFVLLRPKPQMLPISNSGLFLIDAGVIEGIVTDDQEP